MLLDILVAHFSVLKHYCIRCLVMNLSCTASVWDEKNGWAGVRTNDVIDGITMVLRIET